jgi:uncharacterized protein (TIGR01777 family)
MAKVILAGGSGFIGNILARHFMGKGDEVIVLTRKGNSIINNIKHMHWDGCTTGEWVNELEGSNVLINLTGKGVNCRYNEKHKKEIFRSRLDATRVLGIALEMLNSPPPLWINAASATIYRHAEDRPQDEYTGELGTGFSVDVCKQWEATFLKQKIQGVRQIGLRIAIVLGKGGGVIPYFLNLTRFGLGGRQGNGKQYFSWVHENDVTGVIDFLIERKELEGIFNVSAPNPIQNSEFMQRVRSVVKMRFGLPAPIWALKIGVWLLRTETELILKSRWVIPTRLVNEGYKFKVENVKQAIALSRGI